MPIWALTHVGEERDEPVRSLPAVADPDASAAVFRVGEGPRVVAPLPNRGPGLVKRVLLALAGMSMRRPSAITAAGARVPASKVLGEHHCLGTAVAGAAPPRLPLRGAALTRNHDEPPEPLAGEARRATTHPITRRIAFQRIATASLDKTRSGGSVAARDGGRCRLSRQATGRRSLFIRGSVARSESAVMVGRLPRSPGSEAVPTQYGDLDATSAIGSEVTGRLALRTRSRATRTR